MKEQNILILGINGMCGRVVFNYLNKSHSNIFGTQRKNGKINFSSENSNTDFKKIIKKIKKVDYVINCIGINKVSNDNKFKATISNSLLPYQLSLLSEKYDFKIIHISTDAVFQRNSGRRNERNLPMPEDLYGMTKYLGEISHNNAMNFRTSLIGLSPIKKNGLMEFTLNDSDQIHGYTNQQWSGCTTLQFAKLCEYIIYNKKFDYFRKISDIFHFAPLGPITKYKLISEILKTAKKETKLIKSKSDIEIKRYLDSIYFNKTFLNKFNTNTNLVLKELIEFEKVIK
jgi:dTDP-4-dehydrorhamnose reductase